MRTQECRKTIKKAAEYCDLGPDIVSEVERVDDFCNSNPAFAGCATRPIYVLIREQNIEVRNKAISIAQNLLNQETPTGGQIKKKLEEPEIKAILNKVKRELHPPKEKEPKKQDPSKCYSPQPKTIPVTNKLPQPSLAEQLKEKPEPGIIPAPKLAPCNIAYGQPCPDQKNHIDKSNKIKGSCCDIIGIPINQLPGNECPLERKERLKGLQPDTIKPSSQVITGDLSGGKFIKGAPLKIIPVQLSKEEAEDRINSIIRGFFTPKEQNAVGILLQTGELGETYLDLFLALVWEAHERMVGA